MTPEHLAAMKAEIEGSLPAAKVLLRKKLADVERLRANILKAEGAIQLLDQMIQSAAADVEPEQDHRDARPVDKELDNAVKRAESIRGQARSPAGILGALGGIAR